MSITDDMRTEPRGNGQSSPPAQRDGQFDKTPPQDIAAEQCVLGGMLLSKDAIADVVEILKSNDFYRPVHATVFDAVLDLYGRGEPADAITVAAALADAGDLGRIGGAPYLHTLISTVPTAANAAYYARIVGERAVLRRLVEAGTRIVQLGYGTSGNGGRDVDDIVDLAQQAVYDVTERRVNEDFAILADMLQPTLDEIEAVGAQGGVMSGVPTGFTDLDRLLNGLHPGQLIIVAGRPGLGKALALDTPLPTPEGWTTMGEVRVGDRLLGADGCPTTVTAAFDVLHERPCYEVEFSDGSVIVADAEHLWTTTAVAPAPCPWSPEQPERQALRQAPAGSGRDTAVGTLARPASATLADSGRQSAVAMADTSRQSAVAMADGSRPGAAALVGCEPAGPGQVVTTAQIALSLAAGGERRPRHAVRNCAPLQLPARALPVPPYTLGARLGAAGRLPSATDRRIPPPYLRAAEAQRRALLAGLLDTAGTVALDGSLHYTCFSAGLAEDIRDLVVGLGGYCVLTGPAAETDARWSVLLPTEQRSSARGIRAAVGPAGEAPTRRTTHREVRSVYGQWWSAARTGPEARLIVAVRPVSSVPVRCVTVDNDDHLYLAGRAMIPTHNSTASMDFARNSAIRANQAAAIFSLEMSKVEIVMRLLSAEARVPLHVLRSGQLSDDDWTKLARCMGEISEAPLFVDDTPNMNLMEIRAKARRLKQRHDLKMIVVDYLQLMSSPKKTESRQQEVAELSRGLKLLAKEVECPVIAVSQLNRGPEQRTDKRPQLSDLRESGCLTAQTRVVRADDNSEVTLGELLASGAREVPVWALDDRLCYTPRTMTHVFPSGTREVFRLTLASGKRIDATANHPFLTYAGWTPLGELAPGVRLATPRHLPPPLLTRPWPEPQVVLLAHLLGAGRVGAEREIRYASRDELNLETVTLAAKHFGVVATPDWPPAPVTTADDSPAPVTTLRLSAGDHTDPIAQWLLGLGLPATRPGPVFVPKPVFALPKAQITSFLRQLWAAAGSVSVGSPTQPHRLRLVAGSRRLVEDVCRLLLRYGITARLGPEPQGDQPARYVLEISGRDDQLRFLREIGVPGAGSAECAALRTALEAAPTADAAPTAPVEVWDQLRQALLAPGDDDRPRLAGMAGVLAAADLELHATNDVGWDEIVSIESVGVQEVFDATVLGKHNFIANGIATHNSIEQDADVVILLHRDDYYDKESPRAGEADFIVAKHRNGPTDTITVAAQLHLSRFVDMAIV